MDLELNIFEKIHPLLDPIISTLIIVGIPILSVFLMAKLLSKGGKFKPVAHFRGLPSVSRQETNRKLPSWTKHLVLLTRATNHTDEAEDEVVYRFVTMTIVMFIATYVVYGFWTGLFRPANFNVSALFDTWLWIISLMAATLPYAYLRIKLHRIRVKNSYDLIPAVNMMLMKYVEYRGNLYYAIFETNKTLKGEILNAFNGLIPALQGSASSNLDDAIELFVYRTQTSWSVQLGILIHKSELHGDDIEQGLRWLITDMSEVVKITEEVKSENRENVQLGFLPFILLPLSVFFNQYPSGGKSWYYYFGTELGIKMLLFATLYTIICTVIAYIIQKPRNEV